MRKLKTLLTLFVVSLCSWQSVRADEALLDLFPSIPKHSLCDNEMVLTGEGWTITDKVAKSPNIYANSESRETILSGTFTTTADVTISYKVGYSEYYRLDVYLDGVLIRSIDQKIMSSSNFYSYPCYEFVNAGDHIIEWRFTYVGTSSERASIKEIGIISTPQISVDLLEPGSLGTEVLYHVDGVKDVRNLKVKGKLNSEDYAKIDMMTNLMILDLYDADIENIPAEFCSIYKNSYYVPKFENLFRVVLPRNTKSIGESAFASCRSISEIEIPSSVEVIGKASFQYTRIGNANLSNVVDIPEAAFCQCLMLETVAFSANLQSIARQAFSGCFSLNSGIIKFPASMTSIGDDAFYGCRKQNFRFSDAAISIGPDALNNTAIDSLILHNIANFKSRSYTGEYNFILPNLVYAEFPVNICDITGFRGCPKLNAIRLNSPTVANPITNTTISLANIKLIVPDYLVNSYKLHSYWYDAKTIEGFSTAEIQDWVITQPLTLNNSRFEGKPNITLIKSGSLKLNGDAPMTINDLFASRDWNSDTGWNTQILSNCDNITIEGKLTMNHCCRSQRWTFLCLPFDVKVSEVENIKGRKNAIRYYDGANRAQNGTGGNWKDFAEDDIIPAGTGFILQPSESSSTYFYAVDNEQKQFIVQNREFVKPLAANVSDNSANRGWNLVGNPWHCYYNIHKLNFTAPITTWNGSTYVAYSIIDDDYAIKPNEAFFVQCPDEVTEITFPTDGRQLTSVIESQNASRRYGLAENGRQLIDIEVAGSDLKDKTRVVLNEESSLGYETLCDASKFFSMDGDVPQIYSVDEDGNEYAINERPLAEGVVKLRLSIQQAGIYTIMAPRADMKHAVLKDLLTNEVTDLTKDSYTVELEAGVYAERFELNFTGNAVTEMQHMKHDGMEENGQYYNLNGQAVTAPAKGVYIRNGKKMVVK